MKLSIKLARVSLLSAFLFLAVFLIGTSSVSINIFSGVLEGTEHIFIIVVFILVFVSLISSIIACIKFRDKQSLIGLLYSGVSFAIIASITLFVSFIIPDLSAF